MDETLKRKAYLDGINLKKSGLDNETIYARLEKSGVPEELAKEVVLNISLQVKQSQKKTKNENYNISLIVLIIGIIVAIISGFAFPQITIVPIGLIIGGIIGLIRASKNN